MDPSRIATVIFNATSSLSAPAAYAAIVGILLICGLGVPIPEDITLLAAGLLAAGGNISLTGALIAGFAGVMLGDSFLFFMGRRYGKKIFALPGFRRLMTPERVQAAETRIRQNGPFICFIARFLPGLRSPIFAMAGALGVRPIVFLGLDGFAALISVPVWIYLGYWFGNNLEEAMARVKHAQMYVWIGLALLIVGYIGFKVWKKRRERVASPSQLPQV